ncbi:hypothetical protein ACNUDN_02386 [Mycobacterium sp. smrl_JER01]
METVRAIALSAAGTLVLFTTVSDALLTTVRAGRASGPMTQRLADLLWQFALKLGSRRGPPPGTGPAITFAAVTLWVVLLVSGWFLVFSASPGAIVDSQDRPADSWARLYFTAFTVSTLGIGDYRPSGAVFQVLTGVAAIMAFGLATLVITYVASLNSAVASQRRFARQVLGLGSSPVDILHANWTGRDFGPLANELQSLTGSVHGLVEEQLTYPLLHYFSTRQRNAAFWPAIATLNEVILLLDNYVRHEYRPAPLALHPLQRAIDGYLDVLPRARVDHPSSHPPQPDIHELRQVGIPVVLPIAMPSRAHLQRRNTIHAALESQGWKWEAAVYAAHPAAKDERTTA